MIIIQKFHSIDEIDNEFVTDLEKLLKDAFLSFDQFKAIEKNAPEDETFTYFLFFGPTQNAPVGLTMVALKDINPAPYLPWHKRLASQVLHSSHHWKLARWGFEWAPYGLFVSDDKHRAEIQLKTLALIKEYEERPEVEAQVIYAFEPEMKTYHTTWDELFVDQRHAYLGPVHVTKRWQSYEEYLHSLGEQGSIIKEDWKTMSKVLKIKLGDYAPHKDQEELKNKVPPSLHHLLSQDVTGVLTFEGQNGMHGLIRYKLNKYGTMFVDHHFIDTDSSIPAGLYWQYALIKWFELESSKTCLMTKLFSLSTWDDAHLKGHRLPCASKMKINLSRSQYLK